MQSIPVAGTILSDRYYIEEILDAGNTTATMKCFDTRLEVGGVIKMLIGDDQAPEWELRKKAFMDAFRNQAKLNHPNIVHVSNIEMRGGCVYAVMELLKGKTLAEYMEETALTPKEVTELFLSVVDAISMAHTMGIVHRCITPRNIFFNQQGTRLSPRVLNFSDHSCLSEFDLETQIPYLAPEQLENLDNATPASDVFGLCATMFYAFAHHAPVYSDDVEALREFYRDGDINVELPDSIAAEFVPLIQIGLNVEPNERFHDASELLKLLKQIGDGFKLSANLTIDATRCEQPIPTVTPSRPLVVTRSSSAGIPAVAQPGTDASAGVSSPAPSPVVPSSAVSSPIAITDVEENVPLRPRSKSIKIHSAKQTTPSSSASQSIVAPDFQNSPSAILRQHLPEATLPEELRNIYKIRRLISVAENTWVGSVSTFDAPDELYCIKCLVSNNEIAQVVFNEGTRRGEYLASNNEYFASIYARYEDSCAILMPDVPRQPLPECLRENGLFQPVVAVQIAILLARAMGFAHAKGMVSGNLKPSNIIFENRSGVVTPVIYDFGTRLYVSSYSEMPARDLPFVAPELSFNLQNTNAQADVFSFGMCLLYMLTGRTPYRSENAEVLAQEIALCSDLPEFVDGTVDIPADLVQIIRWCTAFNPGQRYASFAEVERDLCVVFQSLSGT